MWHFSIRQIHITIDSLFGWPCIKSYLALSRPRVTVSVTPLPRQHGLLPGPPHTVILRHLGNYRTLRPAGSNVPSTNGGVLPQLHQRQRRQSSRRHTVWREMAAPRSGVIYPVLRHDGDGAAAVFKGITLTCFPSLAPLPLSLLSLYPPIILLCSTWNHPLKSIL